MDLYNEYASKVNYSSAGKYSDSESIMLVLQYNIDLNDRICYYDSINGLARFIQQIRILTNQSNESIAIFLVNDTMDPKLLEPSITYLKEIVETGVQLVLRYRYTVADETVNKFIELFPGEKFVPENVHVIKTPTKKQVI